MNKPCILGTTADPSVGNFFLQEIQACVPAMTWRAVPLMSVLTTSWCAPDFRPRSFFQKILILVSTNRHDSFMPNKGQIWNCDYLDETEARTIFRQKKTFLESQCSFHKSSCKISIRCCLCLHLILDFDGLNFHSFHRIIKVESYAKLKVNCWWKEKYFMVTSPPRSSIFTCDST